MKRRTLLLSAAACPAGFAPLAASAASRTGIGFGEAFPRKIYQKKYFGAVITGVTVVAAGAVSYLTAGAGAPPAAAGVGTVAAWVGGGGAGSYMAGLATIGGWFGGNAMLGAAILNGISLGTVGGAAAWKALPAAQKAISLASIGATTLDGIAVFANPKTGQVDWRIILPIPRGLASDSIRKLIDELNEVSEELASLANKEAKKNAADRSASSPQSPQTKRSASPELTAAKNQHQALTKRVDAEINRAVKAGSPNGDAIVLAVLAHNAGKSDIFRTLIGRVKADPLVKHPYLDYLRAVAALQVGRTSEAERLLYDAVRTAPYAVEPSVLLVIVLGSRDYRGQAAKIDEIVRYADQEFNADRYIPSASLVSLHYRVGTITYRHKNYDSALQEYQKAQEAMSLIEEYWSRKDARDLLEIGQANALHGLGRTAEAKKIFESVRSRAKSDDVKAVLCDQYVGGCQAG